MVLTKPLRLVVGALLLLVAGVAQADTQNLAAERMSELFLERCVEPLLANEPANGSGLSALSREEALAIDNKSTGRAWRAAEAYVTLTEIKTPDAGFYGCAVDWEPSDSAGPEMAYDVVINRVDRWADEAIAQGRVVQIKQCGEQDDTYLRILESRTERTRPVRIVLSYEGPIEFIFLTARETESLGAAQEC